MLVDSSVAWTPVPAVAVPVSAGQLVAQSPLQTDWSPLSLVKAYRVRPSPSTRMSPSLPPATATVVPPVAWAAVVAGAAVAAVPDDSLLLPPQAAAATVSAARSAALASVFLMTGSPGRSRSDQGRAERRPNRRTSSPGRWFPNPGSPDGRRPASGPGGRGVLWGQAGDAVAVHVVAGQAGDHDPAVVGDGDALGEVGEAEEVDGQHTGVGELAVQLAVGEQAGDGEVEVEAGGGAGDDDPSVGLQGDGRAGLAAGGAGRRGQCGHRHVDDAVAVVAECLVGRAVGLQTHHPTAR